MGHPVREVDGSMSNASDLLVLRAMSSRDRDAYYLESSNNKLGDRVEQLTTENIDLREEVAYLKERIDMLAKSLSKANKRLEKA